MKKKTKNNYIFRKVLILSSEVSTAVESAEIAKELKVSVLRIPGAQLAQVVKV